MEKTRLRAVSRQQWEDGQAHFRQGSSAEICLEHFRGWLSWHGSQLTSSLGGLINIHQGRQVFQEQEVIS